MAWQHLKGLIIILIILWVVWYFTGGPYRGNTDKPFMKPLPPVDSGVKYGPQ